VCNIDSLHGWAALIFMLRKRFTFAARFYRLVQIYQFCGYIKTLRGGFNMLGAAGLTSRSCIFALWDALLVVQLKKT
jgi:hypothetical protein